MPANRSSMPISHWMPSSFLFKALSEMERGAATPAVKELMDVLRGRLYFDPFISGLIKSTGQPVSEGQAALKRGKEALERLKRDSPD